ncbi:hypothetical protein LTR85_000883 [Meristemomyces frigidus]|nr:hypothetical protein LTR85_000883 [Meristemomyces frigidus]
MERPRGPNRLKRKERKDYLTAALKTAHSRGLTPTARPWKYDLSHANAKSRHFKGASRTKVKRDTARHAQTTRLAYMKELRLERITASLIQYRNEVAGTGQTAWAAPFRLADWETGYLEARGFAMGDIEAWAEMITTQDSLIAATAFANRNAASAEQPVPLFVLLYLLRRPYLSAQALRILIQQTIGLFAHRAAGRDTIRMPENTVFIMFTRLLRHSREVWPQAMVAIADILLRYLPTVYRGGAASASKQVESLSHMLNKAMHLLAIQTAIEPFGDVAYQEAAIVRVLRFMSEHQPSLQLNREGYRAVIQVQLTQKKAPSEQQWAELKALSWPPWKQERTAMDASITAGEHGVTRAGDTLRRMREAGYHPTEWERAAELYAGWDIDRTPTIQTRALMGTGSARFNSGAATWVARITTTRTAQEAWAAYLAFEDAKLPTSQDVYLAIFQKLREEEKRRRVGMDAGVGTRTSFYRRVLPGDRREVESLPPSTHLYTYTRTPVPTVESFYRQLQDRHVDLNGHCLSFLVANAATLQLGFRHLRSSRALQSDVHTLLSLDPAAAHESVPMIVFTAFMELLCRFTNVSLSKVFGKRSYVQPRILQTTLLDKQPLNPQHPLVFALELLKLRRTTSRPPWNSMLRALTRTATLASMRFLLGQQRELATGDKSMQGSHKEARGALLAYRLVRRVLSMLQEMHVNLDTAGFYHLCLASENATVACWRALREDVRQVESGQTAGLEDRLAVKEANALLRSTSHVTRLKGLFRVLVGGQVAEDNAHQVVPVSATRFGSQEQQATGDVVTLPRLLAVPGPALLHAYIRALGWLSDHEGLLALVEWMVEHNTELAEQRSRHWNGEAMMRKAVVALRVFLERGWLAEQDSQPRRPLADADGDDADGTGSAAGVPAEQVLVTLDLRVKNLRRLERAASAAILAEVEQLVNSVEDWHGWPADGEVERYCRDERFQAIGELYIRS